MTFKVHWRGWVLVAVLAFLALGAGIGYLRSGLPPTSAGVQDGPVIAPFHLVDQNNAPVSQSDVLGRPAALFFGFTYCADVCPTTLATLTASMAKMGAAADRIGVFFVSVDPERDTPAVLKIFLAPFDARIRGLTGAPGQIAALTKSLGIYHEKVDTGKGSYSVDHTALIVMLDAQGRFQSTIAFGEPAEAALAKLNRLAREGRD